MVATTSEKNGQKIEMQLVLSSGSGLVVLIPNVQESVYYKSFRLVKKKKKKKRVCLLDSPSH